MGPGDFSPRQWQIIELVGRDGLSWEEVQAHLELSKGTVENYVNRIRMRVPDTRKPRDLLVLIYQRSRRE